MEKAAKWLIGFCINGGSASPKKQLKILILGMKPKKVIAENTAKIKHWTIKQGTYEEIPNEYATWFIDPPYQFGGEYYRHSNKKIDFYELSDWCRSRNGQVIVCENTKADWLPFKPMTEMQGAVFKTTEAIWSNIPTN